jgi:hypothetical protein
MIEIFFTIIALLIIILLCYLLWDCLVSFHYMKVSYKFNELRQELKSGMIMDFENDIDNKRFYLIRSEFFELVHKGFEKYGTIKKEHFKMMLDTISCLSLKEGIAYKYKRLNYTYDEFKKEVEDSIDDLNLNQYGNNAYWIYRIIMNLFFFIVIIYSVIKLFHIYLIY